MNVLMLALLILSILITMIRASKKDTRLMIVGCLSYALSLVAVVGDILIRLNKSDFAGAMDIYPSMFVVYILGILIVGITCFVECRRIR